MSRWRGSGWRTVTDYLNAAYADPPYLRCGVKHYAEHHDEAGVWDSPDAHRDLIDRMTSEYDAWALSLHTPSLRVILPMCPDICRVMAWVKPFASFKPGVGVAYAWEPVIVYGGRKRTRQQPTVRDWVSANITLKKGLVGAKPVEFCWWLFEVLNLVPGDEFHDLFPGTGIVSEAWDVWRQRHVPTQMVVDGWRNDR